MGQEKKDERYRRIIERIENGETEALSELIRITSGKIFTLAYGFLREKEDALDITQEVLLKLWKRIGKMESKDIDAWLVKVTKNLCIDHYRLKKRRNTKENYERISELQKIDESKREDMRKNLESSLLMIPERQALAFSLRFFNGMKLKEIAEIMEISEGGAKSILFKAIKNLRDLLTKGEK